MSKSLPYSRKDVDYDDAKFRYRSFSKVPPFPNKFNLNSQFNSFSLLSRGARQRCDDGASALARRDAMAIGGGFARDEAGASWLFWLVMRLPWQDEGEVTVKTK